MKRLANSCQQRWRREETLSKNKSWSRDANKGKESYKMDFHAFIAKDVEAGANSFVKSKKRKAELNAIMPS
jgi:hypothetical protein